MLDSLKQVLKFKATFFAGFTFLLSTILLVLTFYALILLGVYKLTLTGDISKATCALLKTNFTVSEILVIRYTAISHSGNTFLRNQWKLLHYRIAHGLHHV